MVRRRDKSEPLAKVSESVGLCVTTLDHTVEFQNGLCKKICGDQIGLHCKKGCRLRMKKGAFTGALAEGALLLKNVYADDHRVDAVVVNDGSKITTLLYEKGARIEGLLKLLAPFGLSRAETEVMKRALEGHANSEIARMLFVSRATLKTHFNNIYKKIPPSLKQELLALTARGEG